MRIALRPPIQLGNNGGIVTLLDPNGLKVDGVAYTGEQAGAEGETIIFPVFWDFRRRGERHTHAWPVYGRDATYDAGGNTLYEQHSVAWPFFKVWHDYENGTSGWDAPFPMAGYRGWASHSQGWVMPIAW